MSKPGIYILGEDITYMGTGAAIHMPISGCMLIGNSYTIDGKAIGNGISIEEGVHVIIDGINFADCFCAISRKSKY